MHRRTTLGLLFALTLAGVGGPAVSPDHDAAADGGSLGEAPLPCGVPAGPIEDCDFSGHAPKLFLVDGGVVPKQIAAPEPGLFLVKCLIRSDARVENCVVIKPVPGDSNARVIHMLEALRVMPFRGPVWLDGGCVQHQPLSVEYVFTLRADPSLLDGGS